MVSIQYYDPHKGDITEDMGPEEATELLLKKAKDGQVVFGRFSDGETITVPSDFAKELRIATNAGLLGKAGVVSLMKKKSDQTLKLVPPVGGG